MRSFAEERFDLPEGAFPFESRFMNIGQARLHYIREGEGPILLFLHGNPAWSFLYRNIIGALRESYDCIALDLPGFGLSKPSVHYGFTPEEHAALVAAFLNRADIRNACLIAHDWGGPPSSGPRTISPSGGKSWRDGKSFCLGHRSPRSKTAAITCGKTLVRKASPRSRLISKDYALRAWSIRH